MNMNYFGATPTLKLLQEYHKKIHFMTRKGRVAGILQQIWRQNPMNYYSELLCLWISSFLDCVIKLLLREPDAKCLSLFLKSWL